MTVKVTPLMCILFEKLEFWSIFASFDAYIYRASKGRQKVKFQGCFGNKCAASCEHSA